VMNPDAHIPGAIVGGGGQGGLKARWPGLMPTDYSNVAPRLGFAYQLNHETVVRGGYGLYYAPMLYGFNGGNNITNNLLGYNILGFLRTPNGRNSTVFLNGYPNAPVPNPNTQLVFDANGNFLAFNNVDYLNQDFHTGRTAQWSLDVQRQINEHFAASLSYIGSHGTRLRSNFQRLDALPLNDLKLGFPILSESLNSALADPKAVAYAQSVGVTLPANANAVFPGFDGNQQVAQALRPFPQYRDFQNLMESRGHSWYDAVNGHLDWRNYYGLQFGVSYTFSKLITDAAEDVQGGSPLSGSYQNPFNTSSLRSVDPNNAAHAIVINAIYELPFGAGKRFLNGRGVVNRIVGGWEVATILSYRSGLPLVPILSGNQASWLNLVGYDGNLRPNLTGQSVLTNTPQSGVNFQLVNPAGFSRPPDFTAPPTTDPANPLYASYYAKPAAFFGTAPAVLSNARVLPFKSEDMTILKNTHINEKTSIEARAVFLNMFNRHRYFMPNMDVNAGGSFGMAGVVGDPTVYGPRVVQLALRLLF